MANSWEDVFNDESLLRRETLYVKSLCLLLLLTYCGGYPLANHKSAAKRARQATRKNAVNSQRKATVRTSEKSLIKALAEKNVKALPELLKEFTSEIAKAAGRGVFKKQMASRKIGRIAARVHAALGK